MTTSRPAVDSAAKRDTKTSTCNIKFVPRLLTAYVGRLDNYTTERDLKEFLQEVGVRDATCQKFIPQDSKTCSTSAFRVSCSKISSTTWKIGKQVRR